MISPRQIHRFRSLTDLDSRFRQKTGQKSRLTRRLASTIDKSSFRWIKLESNYYVASWSVQVEPCSRPLPSNKLNRLAILHEPVTFQLMGVMRKREEGKKGERIAAGLFFQTFLLFLPLFLERFRSEVRLKHHPFWKKIFHVYIITRKRYKVGFIFETDETESDYYTFGRNSLKKIL